MSKFGILGVGNCGCQVAYLGEKKYPELFDSCYINTSEEDLTMVNADDKRKFKIGELNKNEDGTPKEEIEGSGKNRAAMKKYLESEMEYLIEDKSFGDIFEGKKYVFVVVSTAGGTGSGAGPVLFMILKRIYPKINFILISVLPSIEASLMEHGNTLEFLNELYSIIGDDSTYMMYDNETTSNMPIIKSLEMVNDNIIEDIRVLTRVDNYATPYESIDEADMQNILTTPGRIIVARLTEGLTEKVMEDNNLDEMIIRSIKNSCHAEIDRDKKVVRWGIITYFTEEVNKLYRTELKGVSEFIGVPVERFNHNAVNKQNDSLNFMHFIASGLSPINDRTKKITDRVEDLKAATMKNSSNFILSGNSSFDGITKREEKKIDDQLFDLNDIFNKFK